MRLNLRPSDELDFENPEPGMYEGVPEQDYHQKLQLVSQTFLRRAALETPAHAMHELLQPTAPGPDRVRGTRIHEAILEPDRFDRRYALAHRCVARTQEMKQCKSMGTARFYGKKWYCGTHQKRHEHQEPDDIEIVAPDEYDLINTLAAKFHTKSWGRKLMDAAVSKEITLVWNDPSVGILLKGRVDILCWFEKEGIAIAVDMKCLHDCRTRSFMGELYSRGYFLQASMYHDGLFAHGVPLQGFVFCLLETRPPHSIRFFRIKDEALATGWRVLHGESGDGEPGMLHHIFECQRSNDWPEYSDEMQDVGLPEFAYKDLYTWRF